MKNKKIIIIMGIVIILLLAVIVFLVVKDNGSNEALVSDAQKFSQEYTSVREDNKFVYANAEETIDILENGTGVVYLGFPECKWCGKYVVYLDEVAKDKNVDKIYYYNIREDRSNNTDTYKKIVELLDGYLENDEDGNPRIYVPAVVFVNNGSIVGFDDESSLDTLGFSNPSDYWTSDRVDALKARLVSYIDMCNVCVDCNS